MRAFVERKTGATQDSDLSAGTLFSSGLIAGGSIAGILFAILVGTGTIQPFQAIGAAFPYLRGDDSSEKWRLPPSSWRWPSVARMGMRK